MRGEQRCVHAASGFAGGALDSFASCVIHAQVRASPVLERCRAGSRARPRPSETSSTERLTSPSRAGSNRRLGGAPGRRCAGRVQGEHRRLVAGADVEDPAAVVRGRREQRRDDVADVDEVTRLEAVAEDRPSARRRPSARGRSRRRRPRGSQPGAARRRCASRATTWPVPWIRFQPARYSSAQSFAIPYGESGRRGLARRRGPSHSP